MVTMDYNNLLSREKISSLRYTFILFIGFVLVFFSLLRMYSWDIYDIKIISGIGLILLFSGLDFSVKSKISPAGLIGSVVAGLSILSYIVSILPVDFLAFVYAVGIALIVTDLAAAGFMDRVCNRVKDATDAIKDEIRMSVRPHFIEYSQETKDLADMAVDVWRIEKRLGTIKPSLPEAQSKSFENSIARLKRVLSKCEIEILDYTGKKYNEGLNVDILSIEKDQGATFPHIREMIEPTILCKGTIIKKGKVIVVENN
jgi:hypothetical protein